MFNVARRFAYALYVANLVVVVGAWWYFSGGLIASGTTASIFLAFGRLAGLLGMAIILAQIIIISRTPWLERWFGHDRLTRMHRLNGFAAFAFIVVHPFLITIAYAQLSHVSVTSTFFNNVLVLEDVTKALIAYIILLIVVGTSIAGVRRRVKYETWYFIHLSVYLVIILAFGHQMSLGPDAQSWFAVYWYALYAFALGNLTLYRFVRPVYRSWKYRFVVDRIEPGPSSTTSVYISGKHIEQFHLEAGQFVILRFFAKGFWWQAHPFSISKLPVAGAGVGKLTFCVTIKASGDFTRDMIPKLQVGTPVLIDGPHGIFTRRVMMTKKALFIAGGIGITPIRSMIEESQDADLDMQLLYAVRSENDLVFRSDFDAMPNVKKVYFVERRIDESALSTAVPDIRERDVYVCGPPPMMDGIIAILHKLGVPKNQIHFEKFSFASK